MPNAKDPQPKRPFGHARLTLFFVLLGSAWSAIGVLALSRVDPEAPHATSAWVLVACVLGAALTGFAGVFFHRLRVNPVRWRETQEYLLAIRRESEKYRAFLDGAADMLLVVDPEDGSIRESSARAREALRLPKPAPEDSAERGLVGLPAVVAAADLERMRAALRASAAAPGTTVSIEPLCVRGSDGRDLLAHARLATVAIEGRRLVQVSLRDVTAEKELERRLAVHERLSSLGLLTAGVAHEINNPLEGIGNYLKLLERSDLPATDRQRYLDLVRHGFARIGDIVRDLTSFARPRSNAGEADLRAVVERARGLVQYSNEWRGVTLEVRGLDEPLVVPGDAGRLEQVFVNVLLNAGAALAGHGRVEIHARRLDASPAAPEIEIRVADDGPGIPPEAQARVFDPFFTLRDGTGLGLSVSYGIVNAHGGRIWAENGSVRGAVFVIRLPASRVDTTPGRAP